MTAMKSTCSIREPRKAEVEDEDMEVLEDVGKEPAEKSEEALKKSFRPRGRRRAFLSSRLRLS
ncbi:hypothetical protein CsSME_00008884 [Camellia sinensis var. sinensis]